MYIFYSTNVLKQLMGSLSIKWQQLFYSIALIYLNYRLQHLKNERNSDFTHFAVWRGRHCTFSWSLMRRLNQAETAIFRLVSYTSKRSLLLDYSYDVGRPSRNISAELQIRVIIAMLVWHISWKQCVCIGSCILWADP